MSSAGVSAGDFFMFESRYFITSENKAPSLNPDKAAQLKNSS